MTLKEMVGLTIKEWRGRRGFTQKKLAELLGYSVQGVWRIEVGKTDVPLSTLGRIADALDVLVSALVVVSPTRASARDLTRAEAAVRTVVEGTMPRLALEIAQELAKKP